MNALLLALALLLAPIAEARSPDRSLLHRADDAPPLLSEADQESYRILVADLTEAALNDRIEPAHFEQAEQLGMSLRHRGDILELRPGTQSVGAAGVLLLRTGPLAAEVVLAAPHPFDDLRTGGIAATIFENAPVRALFIATQSRYAAGEAEPTLHPESALHITTEVLADRLEQPWFVQIHGYGPGSSEASAVISGGASMTPRTILERSADMLSAIVGGADVRTSRLVPLLSARDNIQGDYLRDRARFVHIELGRDLRIELESNPRWCGLLGDRLVAMASAEAIN